MSLVVQNTNELLETAISKDLYKALVLQLNKDFQLSNIEECYSEMITVERLKNQLYLLVKKLLHEDFDSFLNLLYRIDLSEHKIKKQESQCMQVYIEQVVFLILRREWQKVWLKENYSS